jgi:hypothetical protein
MEALIGWHVPSSGRFSGGRKAAWNIAMIAPWGSRDPVRTARFALVRRWQSISLFGAVCTTTVGDADHLQCECIKVARLGDNTLIGLDFGDVETVLRRLAECVLSLTPPNRNKRAPPGDTHDRAKQS